MRPELGVKLGSGSMVADPAIEKYLLDLHAAMDLESFWKSAQRLLSAAIPNRLIALTLRHDPILPLIERWTLPMPAGFFGTRPLKQFVAAHSGKKILRVADLFSNRRAFARSTIYRRYIARQECEHATCLLFWKARRLICAIVIMRTAAQGNFSATDTKLLRQLHPRFVIALQHLHALERERVVRVDLEEFVRRLPLPTILVRWNLKLLFQNRAARDFCSVWESGFEQARLLKLSASIPMEIVEVCRRLKQRWRHAKKDRESTFNFAPIEVRHPQSPYLKATIRLKQLNDAVAQPHFLIECTDSQRLAEPSTPRARLPQLARLTNREQEVTRLVCNGQSNQEIADAACLSVPTVKKHLHAVFRKLEVTSRSQLMALML